MRKRLSGQTVILKNLTVNETLAQEYYTIIMNNLSEILENMVMFYKKPSFKEVRAQLLCCEKEWKTKESFSYFIFLEKKLIGVIGADISKQHQSAELWYLLDKNYNGFGYMFEALNLLETELFKNGVNRVWATAYPHNTKSSNLLLRSNYTFEGLLRENEYNKYFKRFTSDNLYSKLKSDA